MLACLVGTATGTHVVFNGAYQNGWSGVSTTVFQDVTVVNASTTEAWVWKNMSASTGQNLSAESYWEWDVYCASSGGGDELDYYFVAPSGQEWNETYKFAGSVVIDGVSRSLPYTLSTDAWHTVKFDMAAKSWWSSASPSIQYLKYQFAEQGTYYMRNIRFTGGNGAPQVDAGTNTSITLPTNHLNLDGTVSDDGLPNPPAAVTQTWTKQSGAGTVTFGNINSVDTGATFSTDGVYVLRLTASDSVLQNYDEVTITVNPVPGAGPTISNITTNAGDYPGSQIPAYSKFEITCAVDTSVTNVQLPYDASPPTGITPKVGVSVDAQFTPDNWATTYSQPAFYYQAFDLQTKSGQDWMYPQDSYSWKVRFAPPTAGSWKFKLVAQDETGVFTSNVYNFTVVSSSNPGFIRVSTTDERYFQYENGDPFYGLGYNFVFGTLSWDEPTAAESVFQTVTGYGMNYFRLWINNWGIYGGVSGAWNSPDPALHAQYYPEQALSMEVPTPEVDSDVCMKLQYDYCPVMWLGHMKKSPAVKQNTNYSIFVQYRIPTTMTARGGGSYGLVCKTSQWNDYLYNSGQGTVVSNYAYQATGWTTLTGSFNSGSNDFIPGGHFSMCLENVTDGAVAYVNKVEVRENLGGGNYGPNIINHYWMSKHLYFDQRYSFAFDKVLQLAEEYGVHFQLCLMEKNCWIMDRITDAGVNDEENWSNDYFYGYWTAVTKNRWLQQAFWRYCQARWGYSTSVGAWELLNEGDPWHGRHWTQTDEFGKYMQQFPPNHHITSTSTWGGFPRDEFWGNEAEYPDVDYADLHFYPSSCPDIAAQINSDSTTYGAKQSGGAGKPLMLGETGYFNLTNLQNDTERIWYHNYIWANINHGGMYQQYWCEEGEFGWTPDPRAHNKPYANFIDGIPLNNGHYVGLSPTINGTNIRALGQKDLTNKNAHLWIQNDEHTWYNIVNGNPIGSVTGTVQIGGFTPSATYDLEWWDPYEPVKANQIISSTQVNANGSGVITLSVSSLVDDIAAKIYATAGDSTPPTPNPSTWATVPYATGSTSISMTATTASDPSGVQYYFDCTAGAGGHDSGWQSSATYQDTGLTPSTQYSYRVQTRDQSTNQNAGQWSTTQSATTQAPPDTTPPTPNPSTWATVPYATGSTSISMTATTASDPSGVQYYFDCTAGAGGHDSGWQSSATYQDTGLTPSTQYSYRVQTRDQSTNQNTGQWSTTQSATTQAPPDTTPPTPNPSTWATVPYATGSTSISMTATTASDPSGVQYYFDCTAGAGGHDSAWQSSATYQDTGLSPSTQYSYRVQTRDQSANHNTGAWSTTQSATTDQAVTPSLVSWWEFDNDATDSQGDNDGTLGGSAGYVNDSGYCVQVDGDNGDMVTVPSSADFDTTTGTWMMWVRTDGTWGTDGGSGGSGMGAATLLNRHDASGSASGLNVNINSEGTIGVQVKSGDTSVVNTNSTGTVTNNAWHHIAVTWEQASGGDVKIYIDGSPNGAATASAAWSFNDQTLCMCDSPDTFWEEYDGRLDEVRIYNYEMQVGEIASIYSGGRQTADTTPPTPNPLTWATVPYATGTTSIAMAATTASDPSGVEYFFDCTAGAGGHDSGWQDSTSYQDTGLSPSTQYTYRVQARDKSANQNTGGWSTSQAATTQDGTAPTPNPSTWATVPYATGSTSISMTATTASDPSGVQYFFDCTAGAGGHDSGWQSGATYQDTGLTPSTQYSYRVQTRDQSANQNTGGWSTTQSATTQAGGTTLLTDGFETNFDKWTDGGTTDWDRATAQKRTGSYSAHAGSSDNDLISDNLNSSGYGSMTIDFWYRDDDIDADDDIYLQLYNGSAYANRLELDSTSEDTWQHAVVTVNNSGGDAAYFISNFRIKFEGTSIDSGENLWIDDVLVTASGTGGDSTPPTPNPSTWATVPYATGSTSISMTATTASDPSGVQYYFDCTAGAGGHDSAWQSSATYQDTGLSPSTQYTYRVQTRDQSANQNTGQWSTTQSATTEAGGGASHIVFNGAYQNGWSGIGTTSFQGATVMNAGGDAWSWHHVSNSSAQDVSDTTAWEYEIYFDSAGSGDQIQWHFVSPSGNEWNETYKVGSPAIIDGESATLPATLTTNTWHSVSFDMSAKAWWAADSDSIQYLKWQWPEACTAYLRNVKFTSE